MDAEIHKRRQAEYITNLQQQLSTERDIHYDIVRKLGASVEHLQRKLAWEEHRWKERLETEFGTSPENK